MSKQTKKRILFLVPYPSEGASARLRVEQFLPYLADAGLEYSLRPFYTPAFYRILYKRGHLARKALFFVFCACRRIADILSAPFYDAVFIHREAFPLGPPLLEFCIFLFGKRVVFDYDDAIYLPPEGSSPFIAFLKCPWKTDYMIRRAGVVIAGNDLLCEHARALNRNVVVIPTCIDTDACRPSAPADPRRAIVIGWIGSHTTEVFLKGIEDVLRRLLDRFPALRIHIVGGRAAPFSHDRVFVRTWSLAGERGEIESFDIGVMPMPDTDWTRGKCAFKAILCMSFGIPVVASPVGVNASLIVDGTNGFLAASPAEWERKLGRLIDDAALRRSIGAAGRETVVAGYSVRANAPLFVDAVVSSGARPCI